MSQLPCKRFWEGPVGITLMPRKQQSGEYFWTFAFTRAFKRTGKDSWEYTEFFGQKHASALGKVMSRAIQFMEQNNPGEFTEKWMEQHAVAESNKASPPSTDCNLAEAHIRRAASAAN
ncbi:hypothetical protein [Aeoliella mucimassa]|uniref:Uncharacterized protein n=1 Tax=Aeoliella mucimassa TaxID=2527972 RepID=A0A518AS21_9BACT|nr:hypothetical protein [Aeoliella mucimassa]QDU57522.1 hypothetical protein Pan181_37400 [Aeoliella mucimassa]